MDRKGVSTIMEVLVVMLGTVGAGTMATQGPADTAMDSNISSNISEEEAEGVISRFQAAVSSLTREVGTEVRVYRMTSSKTNINGGKHNEQNYGTLQLHIENTGETTVNTTKFRLNVLSGERPTGNCFTAENSTSLSPRDTYVCDTGVVFPKATTEVELKVLLKGSAKERTVRCRPETTGQVYC